MKKIAAIFLTVLMLSLFAVMALGSGETDPTVTPADSSQNGVNSTGGITDTTESKEGNARVTVRVGETLTTNKLKITYSACEEYTGYSQYFPPKDGYKFIKLSLEVENIGGSGAYISTFEFKCYADGLAMDDKYESDSISATLSAGRKAIGGVYFEVPVDAESIEVEYETNIWSDAKAIFIVE